MLPFLFYLTNKMFCDRIYSHERGINMSIEIVNVLDEKIKKALKEAKRNCLNEKNLSYAGKVHHFQEEGETLTVYSLLPGLEESQLVVRKADDEQKKILMVKADLVATISEDAFVELMSNIYASQNNLEDNDQAMEFDVLPDEIKKAYRTMQQISLRECSDELDLLFKEYALLTEKWHQIHKKYYSIENKSKKRAR